MTEVCARVDFLEASAFDKGVHVGGTAGSVCAADEEPVCSADDHSSDAGFAGVIIGR